MEITQQRRSAKAPPGTPRDREAKPKEVNRHGRHAQEHPSSFIVLLQRYLKDRGYIPNELYRRLRGRRPGGQDPSRSTIHAYFGGFQTPQPWFVLACCEVLGLSEQERLALYDAYFASYR